MAHGRHTTRLNKIEDAVNERRPKGPPMMPQEERWDFVLRLVREILEGGDGSMGRRFSELEGMNRKVLGNILWGGWSLGWWGNKDECQRVKDWLVVQVSQAVYP